MATPSFMVNLKSKLFALPAGLAQKLLPVQRIRVDPSAPPQIAPLTTFGEAGQGSGYFRFWRAIRRYCLPF